MRRSSQLDFIILFTLQVNTRIVSWKRLQLLPSRSVLTYHSTTLTIWTKYTFVWLFFFLYPECPGFKFWLLDWLLDWASLFCQSLWADAGIASLIMPWPLPSTSLQFIIHYHLTIQYCIVWDSNSAIKLTMNEFTVSFNYASLNNVRTNRHIMDSKPY